MSPSITPGRVAGFITGKVASTRSRMPLNLSVLQELVTERRGGHAPAAGHRPHLEAAIEWLARAQDAGRDEGFSRGYSLVWQRQFGRPGWQPSYPETTGYIIPTMYQAARVFGRAELAQRAERAARWELRVRLPSGAVTRGVIGQSTSPAVFNTGQVIFGWLVALDTTGDDTFATAIEQAAAFLVATLDGEGLWRGGTSGQAHPDATLYNARTAWALAQAGRRLGEGSFVDAAAANLDAVVRRQHANGWLPDCCLSDPARPLLHTIAYAVRGLVEGGRVLGSDRVLRAGALAAEQLAQRVEPDGWMSGRFASDWSAAVRWSCLTGEAQMVNNWIRLAQITGERAWLEPVARVLRFLESTQNLTTRHPGLRGGIRGSAPMRGNYGRYEVLNWATKFFADALMRYQEVTDGATASPVHTLA